MKEIQRGLLPAKRHIPLPSIQPVQRNAAMQTTQTPPDLVPRDLTQRARDDSSSLNPGDLLYLQRSIGNRAVSELLSRNGSDEGEASHIGAEGGEVDGNLSGEIQRARGGGSTLSSGVASEMNKRTGLETKDVRIHTGKQADTISRQLNAEAFTLGRDIFFSSGAYRPESASGKQLLAHELTHVAQQGGGAQHAIQPKLKVGAANSRHEREADRVAGSFAGGGTAQGRVPYKPGSAPSGANAPTIQRMMKFKNSDLVRQDQNQNSGGRGLFKPPKEKVSKRQKAANKLGFDSNFQKIKSLLAVYWQTHGNLEQQQMILNKLLGLADLYLRKHKSKKDSQKLGSDRDFKDKAIAKLRWEIMVELKKMPRKVASRDFEKRFGINSEYTRGVRLTESPYDPLAVGKQAAHDEKHNVAHDPYSEGNIKISTGDGKSRTEMVTEDSVAKQMQKYKAQKHLKLTPAERNAMKMYTGNQFEYINPSMEGSEEWLKSVLKGKHKDGVLREDDATVKKIMDVNKDIGGMVNSALNTLPPWKQTKTLYRGETVPEAEAAEFKSGHTKHYKFFASTSLDLKTPRNMIKLFTSPERPWGIVYHITSSKTGRDVSPFSQNPNELEILFPSGSNFNVKRVLSKDDAQKKIEVEVTVT